MPKIIGIDIEATNLKADFGVTIAFGWKELGKPAKTLNILKYYNQCSDGYTHFTEKDKPLLKEAWEIMAGADTWYGWYSKGYDLKFLNSRMLLAGLPPLPPVPHLDLYFTAKANFALSSNRLAAWQEFLSLDVAKTPLLRETWRRAAEGNPTALKYVAIHCKKDVEVLEGVYAKLMPFIRQFPKFNNDLGECSYCFMPTLQRRGPAYSSTLLVTPKVRVFCTTCLKWDTRTEEQPLAQEDEAA